MIAMLLTTMVHLSGDCAIAKLRETDAKNKCEAATKTKADDREELCRDAVRAEATRKAACQ